MVAVWRGHLGLCSTFVPTAFRGVSSYTGFALIYLGYVMLTEWWFLFVVAVAWAPWSCSAFVLTASSGVSSYTGFGLIGLRDVDSMVVPICGRSLAWAPWSCSTSVPTDFPVRRRTPALV